MNLCFNKSDSSEYDPNQSYKKPSHLIKGYSPLESVYELDPSSGEYKEFIKNEMQKFNFNYDLSEGGNAETPMNYDGPKFETVFEKIKRWATKAKMESEMPILSLIYVEKLMKKTGILINENNWERLVLITLCIASKIWDDDSLENEHFAKVLDEVTLKDISALETAFLNLIEYEVVVTSKQFAKYSFILNSLCNDEVVEIDSPKIINKVKKHIFESERPLNKYRNRTNIK